MQKGSVEGVKKGFGGGGGEAVLWIPNSNQQIPHNIRGKATLDSLSGLSKSSKVLNFLHSLRT